MCVFQIVLEGDDMLHFILFYISYFLILVQFILILFADLKAVTYINTYSEEETENTPLLGDVHQADQHSNSNSQQTSTLVCCLNNNIF